MKREAHFNTLLNQYLREMRKQGFYIYYELKQTNTDSFAFGKIRKVQWDGLQAAEENGVIWKWSDEISRPKPLDGQSTPPLPSYLIIKFPDGFYFIRFNKIVELRDSSVISISRGRAAEIADRIVKL